MKDAGELNGNELIREILKEQKRHTGAAWITAFFAALAAAGMVAALILVVPKALTTMKNVDQVMTAIGVTAEHANKTMDEIDQMVGNVNELVMENTEDVDAALDQITSIDIETLNESIRKLNEVVEPLSKMFSVLGR